MAQPEKLKSPYVEFRRRWSDPWTLAPYLDVDQFDQCLPPSIATARLIWRYGNISDRGAAFATCEPVLERLIGCYLRILRPARVEEIEGDAHYVPASPVWHGFISGGEDDRGGGVAGEPARGDEHVTARGLEGLLAESAVDGSYVASGATAVKVDALLPFNLHDGRSDELVGNRSAEKVADADGRLTFVFSDTEHQVWTAGDVAEYIVVRFGPPALALTLAGQVANLAIQREPFGTFRTVWEALSGLIARNRGHAWRIAVTQVNDEGEYDVGAAETLSVYVYSTFPEAVTAGGQTIEPAAVTGTIDADAAAVAGVLVSRSEESRFDRVVARGSPIIVMGTLSVTSGELEKAWSAAQETAYEAADAVGRAADQYKHVFTSLRVKAASLPGGPTCDDQGFLVSLGTATRFQAGQRFLRRLPIVETDDDASGPTDFRPPLAIGSLTVGATTYYLMDRLAEQIEGAPSMTLRMLDGELGVQLQARPNHLLALNHFAGDGGGFEPVFDYEDILFTVAWASTEHLTVEAAVTSDPTIDRTRTLVIDVPDCHAWYRLAGTVTDARDGCLTTQEAAVLRNDRDRLAAVAAMAKAWYARRRAALTVTYDDMVYDFQAGWLITRLEGEAGGTEINTIVSRVVWDAAAGRTTVQTDFCELDFRSAAGASRRGGDATLAVPALAAPFVADRLENHPVRIGQGVSTVGAVIGALVTVDGGAAGGEDSECTWTYTVKTLDDSRVLKKNVAGDAATGMTPERPRYHFTEYWYAGETRTAPAVATSRYATILYLADGTLILLDCLGEIAVDFDCAEA